VLLPATEPDALGAPSARPCHHHWVSLSSAHQTPPTAVDDLHRGRHPARCRPSLAATLRQCWVPSPSAAPVHLCREAQQLQMDSQPDRWRLRRAVRLQWLTIVLCGRCAAWTVLSDAANIRVHLGNVPAVTGLWRRLVQHHIMKCHAGPSFGDPGCIHGAGLKTRPVTEPRLQLQP